MPEKILPHRAGDVTPVTMVGIADWPRLEGGLSDEVRAAARLAGFAGKADQLALAPSPSGTVTAALFGLGEASTAGAMAARGLAARLPAGDYRLEAPLDGLSPAGLALAWSLGAYRYDRYKKARETKAARLVVDRGVDFDAVRAVAAACAMARDMVNTPANDMGPRQVESIAREIAEAHGAAITVTLGDDLLDQGYPAVHAVGRAAVAERAPRMIEILWGAPEHPLIALVGKGVVFDTGGLDIKAAAGMRLMKKDMGGAAHALALARMVMSAALPVRLAVLLPVVENAIAGDAMRPGDVVASRAGLSIEVGNTDAEGRLILADALTRAGELGPEITIDLATLTGAARVALGPQVVPFYATDDALAAELAAAALAEEDPVWRMPLWPGYACALDSDIADIRNDADGWAQAGSVTAALFLQRFAPKGPWAHFDIFAWNPKARPGWPAGAEVQAIRTIFAVLKARYR
jgi:leucyl aminopeptidase